MKIVWGLLGTLCLTSAAHAVPVVVQVLAADNSPVAGAEVRISRQPGLEAAAAFLSADEPQREMARTDAVGVARFDWPAPKVDLSAGVMARATIWAPGMGAANLKLMAGDNRVKLMPMGIARGTVRDLKGAPVAGVKVRAVGALGIEKIRSFSGGENFAVSEDEATFTAISDAQGRWQIGNLPIGTRAMVQIEDTALASDVATAPVLPENAPAAAIVVPIAQMPRGANDRGELVAAPAATLTGRVLKPDGEPLARVDVWLLPEKNQIQTHAQPKVARTDENGEYRLERLEADTYEFILTPPETLPLIANSEAERVRVESGQTVRAPDQKLLPSGTIVLQVNDAKTGQPISGISAIAQETKGGTSAQGHSAESGIIQLQVAAGTYEVTIWKSIGGYVRSQPVKALEIATGETKNLTVNLKSGPLVAGHIVDKQGRNVPNVRYIFTPDKDSELSADAGYSDATGAWKTQSLAPGSYQVSVARGAEWQWELAAPQTLRVPMREPFDITVQPIAQSQLTGRVVDSAGQGVAGVNIEAKITVETETYRTNLLRAAVSDASGHYTLPDFPTRTTAVAIEATRENYALQKAGEAARENNQWSATDIVLQARSSQLSGTVVDANNQPQAGVQVLAPRFDSVAVSNENGAWQFAAVAPGDVELVAVGQAGGAVQSLVAGRENVQLKLQPFAPAAPRDIDGALAVLDDAWQNSRGDHDFLRRSLPATLAPYDPDAALSLARDGAEGADETTVVQIVQVLAAKDAERAREWAPQVLAGLEKPENKLGAALFLAQALADKHPDEAKALLQKYRTLYDQLPNKYEQSNAAMALATLSRKLQLPDGEDWFARALELVYGQGNGYQRLAWSVGTVDADWAQRTIEGAIEAGRTQTDNEAGPDSAAVAAIRRLAPWNLAAAEKLLDKYHDLKSRDANTSYEMERARAAVIVEGLRKNGDVDAATTAARQLSSTVRTLSQIAAIAPLERRTDILRATLKWARAHESTKTPAIRIAWQLLPYDRATAKSALDDIAAGFDTQSPRETYSSDNEVAAWAYAYRNIDATQARWQLEREWARLIDQSDDNHQTKGARYSQLQKIILVMAAIDVARARQMIFALPLDDNDAPFRAAQVLARWMLASEAERQTRPFEVWDDDDDNDGLYADRW